MYLLFSCLSALLYSMITTVTMIYQVEVIRLSPLQLILAGTTFEIVCFIFQIPTGMIADLYSRKLSIVVGLALTGIGFLIQGCFPSYMSVLVSAIFWGIGSTLMDGAVEAWISNEADSKDINSIFISGAQVGQIGSVVGILLSTVMGNFSIALPIRMGGAMLITLGLFLAVFMPEYHFTSVAPEELNTFGKMSFTIKSGMKIIKSEKILMMFMLIALFKGLASEGYDRLNTAHFLKDTMLPHIGNLKPVTWFGIFGILGMIISTITMQIIINKRKATNNNDSTRLLFNINLFYAMVMVAFGLTKNFSLMLITYLLINMLKSINKPIMNALITSHTKSSFRATVLSTNGQINSLGEVLGGPIIGVIANRYSIGIGISSTVIFLIPIIIILLKMKWKRNL